MAGRTGRAVSERRPRMRRRGILAERVVQRETGMRQWLLPVLTEAWRMGLFVMAAILLMWGVLGVR